MARVTLFIQRARAILVFGSKFAKNDNYASL